MGIVARLVFLQVLHHQEMVVRAENQYGREMKAPAKRGEIFDRHGRLLAYSVDVDSIYAVPCQINDTDGTARQLCAVLDVCNSTERAAVARQLGRPGAFAYVKRRVSPAESQAVATLQLEGIGFTRESKRFYPNRELASGAHRLRLRGVHDPARLRRPPG